MEYDWILDSGWLPALTIRYGIRYQLRERLKSLKCRSTEEAIQQKVEFVTSLRAQPIAIETDAANRQHYEVGSGVLEACLGPRMKYSCYLYPTGQETLGQAEMAMLELYLDRAQLKDGMRILDLGCGWGTTSLFLAEVLPRAKIVAFSNSKSQKDYIDKQIRARGLRNVEVITGDVVSYNFQSESFDRVISIELFEHMKNYGLLMEKIGRSLKMDGKLFVHIFSHVDTPYHFEDGWMSRTFFTGGTMPSADLLLYFQEHMALQKQWWVSGKHYAHTCEDWLARLEENQGTVMPHLKETYGKEDAMAWYQRWRIFYMACAELFAASNGDTWGISHYLFAKGDTSLDKA